MNYVTISVHLYVFSPHDQDFHFVLQNFQTMCLVCSNREVGLVNDLEACPVSLRLSVDWILKLPNEGGKAKAKAAAAAPATETQAPLEQQLSQVLPQRRRCSLKRRLLSARSCPQKFRRCGASWPQETRHSQDGSTGADHISNSIWM